MPAKSKSQQRFFGMVHKCQKTGNCDSPKIKKVADEIDYKDADDFASTKHKGLPEKKDEGFNRYSFKTWLERRAIITSRTEIGRDGNYTTVFTSQTADTPAVSIDAAQVRRLQTLGAIMMPELRGDSSSTLPWSKT